MSDPRFIHLRVHSEYSITDSIVRLPALVAAAAADAQPAVAITDLANMFGWIKFYKAARSSGVKPILGVDCWVTHHDDRDRPSRVLLLARNQAGYLRLCELVSRAWLENEWRGRGEIDPAWFDEGGEDANDGLIALSGASAGEIGRALLAGQHELAVQAAQRWSARFPGAFYLEVQRAGQPEDESQTRLAATLALRLGLPVVATHPVQFIGRDEFSSHEARVCIAEGEILGNRRRVRRFTEEQYLKSQDEMAELFADLPSALANSVEIARRCSLTMTLDKPQLPDFPTPAGESLDDYLRRLAAEGLATRMQALFPDPRLREEKRPEYEARLAHECDMIIKMGFPGYFLIVADFINWAKGNGVPVGPGRGSGAGSLVAYALGITDLDPIPYALLFERFLNPERVSMPDFDIDFCQDNRYKVIEYVRSTYGADAVSQIATFGTMASKAVIRDVGRVLELPYNFCDQLSKLVPVFQNKPLSLAKAREAEPLLAERERSEEEVRELLALAGPLEDLSRNIGMHAGGVLIAPGRLTDFTPLYKAPGSDGGVVSQYDKDDVEAVGLVKFDFLGLRNLTIIQLAVDYINRRHPGLALDLAALEFNDPKAYQILKDANTTAIFQVEGDGMKKLLAKLAPDRFEDIIAVLALYRPGPLGSGMVDDFILRKKGQQAIDYFHPDLRQTLEPTYGVIVYQEQVMQIAQIIGGYTLGGADLLRRAMGKKKPEEMAKHRDIFVAGAEQKGYGADLANRLFDLMAMFAEYGFNKSHTAAYAVITYQTAWLKAHYPAEFMAATLSSDMDDTDKVQLFVDDAQSSANGVRVLPPDINACGYRFEPVADDAIRYGLGAIKGTGEAAVTEILRARETGPFTCLFDFCARIDRRLVGRRTIEALVRAGAFDGVDPDRAKLLVNVGRAIDTADLAEAQADQVNLFGDGPSGPGTPQWIPGPVWTDRQRLLEEKSALGFFLTGHLFSSCADEVRRFVRTPLERLAPGPQPVWIAGIVTAQSTRMTRRGKMAFVTLDDGTAKVEASVFNELYDQSRHLIQGDDLLVVLAKVSQDDYSGGVRVVAERVLDLAGARAEFARALRLSMNGNACGARLRELIGEYRARASGCPVEIAYCNDTASCVVRLPDDWRVALQDTMLDELREWLDAASVELVYA
ncbi:MAG: DNA polymerase III subunit alpha [Burkholderiaceae bacterium]|jgi:DNA polymerase-3 subunit alpha|nr:DNA polymerase III subunit alpha [Burkholderiaceae bacterium]MEB2319118.1 DNA polymerase III subunit alpha [Pseudomonadota bacterium]